MVGVLPGAPPEGAATWGNTREDAIKNLEDVVPVVVESLIEHGEPVLESPVGEVHVSEEPRVAVTIQTP